MQPTPRRSRTCRACLLAAGSAGKGGAAPTAAPRRRHQARHQAEATAGGLGRWQGCDLQQWLPRLPPLHVGCKTGFPGAQHLQLTHHAAHGRCPRTPPLCHRRAARSIAQTGTPTAAQRASSTSVTRRCRRIRQQQRQQWRRRPPVAAQTCPSC
eukprot:363998-Chlamydomonas_euryale.AAC.3